MQGCLFANLSLDVDPGIVGIYAVHMDTGEVILEKNSSLNFMPASCLKTMTTGAALHLLGEDYQFTTTLSFDGTIDTVNSLDGNLYIQGGGDPTLGSSRIAEVLPWKKQIEKWADEVQKAGIATIKGKVIGDASLWETALAVPVWTWEDLGNYYGAGACALSFHENSYELFLHPGDKEGDLVEILETEPALLGITLKNELKAGPKNSGDGACIYGSEFSAKQFIRGTIPAGVEKFVIKGAISDPATYCAALLTKELESRGVVIQQEEIPKQQIRSVLHTTFSPKMKEIVYVVNQNSLNLYAEHLVKKMGEHLYKEGSTQSGVKAICDFWSSQGVDLQGACITDGSGLSRKNLITPKQLVSILLTMKKSAVFPTFLASLPQGVKSGSMSGAYGLVGYVNNIAFAILINHLPNRQMAKDKVKEFLYHLSADFKEK